MEVAGSDVGREVEVEHTFWNTFRANTFCHIDKYILGFEQIHLANLTKTSKIKVGAAGSNVDHTC